MLVLGISGGHDANWALVRDGRLIAAFEKERFVRRRHASGEVVSLLPQSLAWLGLSLENVDLVATSEPVKPGTGPGHRVRTGGTYAHVGEWVWQEVDLLDITKPCVSVPHHLAHAAYSYLTSGFDTSAAITWDGGGDFYAGDAAAATTVSSWRQGRLEWIERIDGCDVGSLWYVYARAIFGEGDHSGKLMGLAALGSDRLVADVRSRYAFATDGRFRGALGIADTWAEFGAPALLPGVAAWKSERAQDLAFAIQRLTDEVAGSIASIVRRSTGHTRVVLGGGVSMNGYLCTTVRQESGFDEVFVPPAVHDGGIAAGCALFAATLAGDGVRPPDSPLQLACLGQSYSLAQVRAAIAGAGHAGRSLSPRDSEIQAAEALAGGLTVGWFEGRSEHGPRALGSRSVLAPASLPGMRFTVNDRLKLRERFRPLAPAVLANDASRLFEIPVPSPFMMSIVPATEEGHAVLPEALHVDGTARVQSVDPPTRLGRILTTLGEITGVPAAINTSLNRRTPIAETPADAAELWSRMPLDRLYIEGIELSRP